MRVVNLRSSPIKLYVGFGIRITFSNVEQWIDAKSAGNFGDLNSHIGRLNFMTRTAISDMLRE
jgi:hypothetical protein